MTKNPVEQLHAAGYLGAITELTVENGEVRGRMLRPAIDSLLRDARFQQGVGYVLHTDVGNDLVDLRSYRGEFGPGSLQLVVDLETGRCYADVDVFSPYADVVGFLGHNLGEVIPNWWKALWRRHGQRPAEQLDARDGRAEDRRG